MSVKLILLKQLLFKNETVLVYRKNKPNYINIDQSDEYKQN